MKVTLYIVKRETDSKSVGEFEKSYTDFQAARTQFVMLSESATKAMGLNANEYQMQHSKRVGFDDYEDYFEKGVINSKGVYNRGRYSRTTLRQVTVEI